MSHPMSVEIIVLPYKNCDDVFDDMDHVKQVSVLSKVQSYNSKDI